MFFFFKQKTAYELRISDWSSDVCSSDLLAAFELDAGLTYLDFEPPAHDLSVPLYVERSMLISAVDGVPIPEPLDWADLARLPLCLLHQGIDRKSVVSGKSVSVRVDLGGRRTIKKQRSNTIYRQATQHTIYDMECAEI